jgi:hypothetical protein
MTTTLKHYLDENGWLPKQHLSDSQIELAIKSPPQYYKKYFGGAPAFDSPQLAFGKAITDILEGRVEGEPELIEQVKNVPRFLQTNVELRQTLNHQSGKEVEVIGYMDAFEEEIEHIIDYKTGVVPWTNDRLMQSSQFKLYSLLRWIAKDKQVIPQVTIIWMPTEKVSIPSEYNGLSSGFTMRICGEPRIFTHQFSVPDLLDSHARVFQAYDIIKKLSKQKDAE